MNAYAAGLADPLVSAREWLRTCKYHSMNSPTECSLSEIERRARLAVSDPVWLCFAGSPSLMAAPDGMAEILRRGGLRELASTGGLTLIKNAAAFNAPQFVTTNTYKRNGTNVQHFATVQKTTTSDVVHESFYPAAGDHVRPGMTHQEGGRTFQHYWRVSRELSELIRKGEQEHLDDAQRAFELTYQLIGKAINSLAGQTFGPASSPFAAQKLAESALGRTVPANLGINPATWPQVLDRLLQQTRTRDTQQWHSLMTGPPITEGSKVIHPVMTTEKTNIGVASNKVVNY